MGSGSPSAEVQSAFVNAFYRNGFANLVAVPPLADVKRFGSTGLLQEFQNAAKTAGVKFALIKPDTTPSLNVIQVYSDIYAYYSTVGVATAGYPTADTQTCPTVPNLPACTYQFFSLNTALFAYATGSINGQDFSVVDPFYTKWKGLGGLSGALGLPTDTQRAVTASTGTTATGQIFSGGVIYKITSGTYSGQTFALTSPINDIYQGPAGGFNGFLGLPTSDEMSLASGLHRQTFEGGRIEYTPGSGVAPQILLPVDQVSLSGGNAVHLQIGGTFQVTAQPLAANGASLTGRAVSWATSNSRVVTIQANGATATLTAVGSGVANVTATSEGKVSAPIVVTVAGQCCQIGDGAPTAVAQAFQSAVTRNKLSVLLPAASGAQRLGSGYVQVLVPASGVAGVQYLIAESDRSLNAYIVTGALLAAYQQLGGPSGALGYPSTDATAGGAQLFESGAALGGNPLHVVPAVVAAKWNALGLDTGAAGVPVSDAATFTSQSGYAGVSQAFSNGAIVGVTSGSRGGQAYFVSGLILARYTALGGPAGSFGLPTGDEIASGATRRQSFENGYIDYTPGDTAALDHAVARQPGISANPTAVVAGSRVHLAVSGFLNGSTLRVSIAGQPDFIVSAPGGSYEWDAYIPASSKSGAVGIHAADATPGNAPASADGGYTVRSLAEAHPQLVKLQGDMQSGAPGATLPLPLQVMLQDSGNNPIAGIAVTFNASPGGQITPAAAITDAKGQASATLRLPPSAGIAAATAVAAGQIVSFNARVARTSLTNFPQFALANDGNPLGNGSFTIARSGALLAAAAAIIRFEQGRGDLPAPNGLADPDTLNQYLKNACVTDSQGNKICDGFLVNPASGEQVVNLWRLAGFVGGGLDVSVENTDPATVRDLLQTGIPVLMNLALSADGTSMGGTTVVATGIADNGQIQIFDPSAFARTSLDDYLNGFSSGGHTWQGTLLSAVRLIARTPAVTGFLVTAISQPAGSLAALASSAAGGPGAGGCSRTMSVQDSSGPLVSRFEYCDGSQAVYQLSVGNSGAAGFRAGITDLAPSGSATDLSGNAAAIYKLTRPASLLQIGPQNVSFAATAVVNAATFGPGLALGGLFSVFGSGLAAADGSAAVDFSGEPATVIAASAFQLNGQVPADLAPGTYAVRVQSAGGTATQQVDVAAVAPGIFVLGTTSDKQAIGAIVNADGSVNGPSSPAHRGDTIVVYGTGLGATSPQGNLAATNAPVAGVLNGTAITAAFAGLTPGFTGLYQVNLQIPAAAAPGLLQPFQLRESGVDSNTVFLSIQ